MRRGVLFCFLVCFLLFSTGLVAFANVVAVDIPLQKAWPSPAEAVTSSSVYELTGSASYPWIKIQPQSCGSEDYLVHTANVRLVWEEDTTAPTPAGTCGYQSFHFGSDVGGSNLVEMTGGVIKSNGVNLYTGVQNGVWYQTTTEINMRNHTYRVSVYDADGTVKLGGMKNFSSIPLSAGKAWAEESVLDHVRMMAGENSAVTYGFTNIQLKRLQAGEALETLHYFDASVRELKDSEGTWPQFNYFINAAGGDVSVEPLPTDAARIRISFSGSVVYPEGAGATGAVGQVLPYFGGAAVSNMRLNIMPAGSSLAGGSNVDNISNGSGAWRDYVLDMDFLKGTYSYASSEGQTARLPLPAGASAEMLTRLCFVRGFDKATYAFHHKNFEITYIPSQTISIEPVQNGRVFCGDTLVENSVKVEKGASLALTFVPDTGYELKSVLVDGQEMIAVVQDNVLTLDSILKDKTLCVVFSQKEIKKPSVTVTILETDASYQPQGEQGTVPSALMYCKIDPGYGYDLQSTGVYLVDENSQETLLLPVVSWTEDGLWGIRIYGDGLKAGQGYSLTPMVRFDKDGEEEETKGQEESFTMTAEEEQNEEEGEK